MMEKYDRKPDIDQIVRVLTTHTGQLVSREQAETFWSQHSTHGWSASWVIIRDDDFIREAYERAVNYNPVVAIEVHRATQKLQDRIKDLEKAYDID